MPDTLGTIKAYWTNKATKMSSYLRAVTLKNHLSSAKQLIVGSHQYQNYVTTYKWHISFTTASKARCKIYTVVQKLSQSGLKLFLQLR